MEQNGNDTMRKRMNDPAQGPRSRTNDPAQGPRSRKNDPDKSLILGRTIQIGPSF